MRKYSILNQQVVKVSKKVKALFDNPRAFQERDDLIFYNQFGLDMQKDQVFSQMHKVTRIFPLN